MLHVLANRHVDETFIVSGLTHDDGFVPLLDLSILKLDAEVSVRFGIPRQHDDSRCISIEPVNDAGSWVVIRRSGSEAIRLVRADTRDRQHGYRLVEDDDVRIGMQNKGEPGWRGWVGTIVDHVGAVSYVSPWTHALACC